MLVQIKELRYWKTEHKDLDNCQDAYDLDSSKGLFVVADGAGTTLFPAIWAGILAKHFVNIPLMSAHPFEVDWWVRLAQDKYKTSIPDMAHLLDWSIRQKALSESSDSTLATVRISARDASSAQAELLVFGDSCVIIGNTNTKKVESFVLENAAQFAQAPICIPSSLKFFNHYFHTCSLKSVTLRPEHIMILASDAVSKWIVGGGSGHDNDDTDVWEAFQTVCGLSKETWPDFIESCRDAKEMVNDDSTALILMFTEDGAGEGDPLGETAGYTDAIIQERKVAFEKAQQEQNNELVAIYYGDGKDIGFLFPEVTDEKIEHARNVADALQEVLRAFRQAQNTPGLVAKMQQVWRRSGPILEKEKCAENIRETLRRNGVNLSLKEPEPPSQVQTEPDAVSISSASTIQSPPVQPVPQPNPQTLASQRAEQEKEALEHIFLRAYSASYEGSENSDKVLLASKKALEAVWLDYQFTNAQKKQISQAEAHTQALEKLCKALSSGLIEQISLAYNPDQILSDRLTPDELESVKLACLLVKAFETDNDETILALDQQIQVADHRKLFSFTEQDRQRITLAQQRKRALSTFRTYLTTGNLRETANHYDPILNESKELTESEREWLHLARAFVAAFDADADGAIMAVYEKIMRSSYYDQVAFTRKERQRIQEAKESLKAIQVASQTIVAKIKGREISLEQVRKVSIMLKAINCYWIEQYQKEIANTTDTEVKQKKEQEIAYLQENTKTRSLVDTALDHLINDILIHTKVAEDNAQENPLTETDERQLVLSQHYNSFKLTMVPDYQAFLKRKKLADSDVREILQLFLRFDAFKSYFENQQKAPQRGFIKNPLQKPMQLNEWIEKQSKEVIHTYSSNGEKRAVWLAEQLGWKE